MPRNRYDIENAIPQIVRRRLRGLILKTKEGHNSACFGLDNNGVSKGPQLPIAGNMITMGVSVSHDQRQAFPVVSSQPLMHLTLYDLCHVRCTCAGIK